MLATHLLVTVAAFALLIPTPDTVKEDETGVRFSTELQPPGGPDGERDQHLLATGCREKFWINVYAYGLYLDQVGAFGELSKMIAGKSNVKLSMKDVERINVAAIPRTLRLVMVREIDAEDLREAFEDYLGRRLKNRGNAEAQKKSFAHLKTFRDYFADDVSDGTEIVFVWRPGTKPGESGTLTTSISGRIVGNLPSADVAWALFDCYVGKDPISEDAVETMAKQLPGALRSGAVAAKREEDEQAAKKAGGNG
jgi:hypothetical protein